MKELEIVDKLKEFISGSIDLENLSEVIDERLFELRQKPELTPEQEILSNLELYVHEAKEGYRSWDELYEFMLTIIERDISDHFVKTIPLNTSSISEFHTINRAIPVKDYRPGLLLV